MEAAIKAQFSQQVLDRFVRAFGLEDDLEALDGFESYIYEGRLGDTPCILRVSHSLHRTREQIAAEVSWVAYLAAAGICACPALPSTAGRLVESIDTESGHFSAVAFIKAPGAPADGTTWGPALFAQMGRMMGRMHVLAASYRPVAPEGRPTWEEECEDACRHFPAADTPILDGYRTLVEETRQLSTGSDVYGLVHLDFHRGNFLVADGDIHLFDFDDCQYSWFADDIAMALFYAVPHDCSSREDLDAAAAFLRCFLDGYRMEANIESSWVARIPLFLKRREYELYSVINRSYPDGDYDPWSAGFMVSRREKLSEGVPYVDLDFGRF